MSVLGALTAALAIFAIVINLVVIVGRRDRER